jgi:large subunit ribosomal protein L29
MAKKESINKILNDMSDADLQVRISEDQMRLTKLKFSHAISPLENPMTIKDLRRDVARLKTEQQKRKLA